MSTYIEQIYRRDRQKDRERKETLAEKDCKMQRDEQRRNKVGFMVEGGAKYYNLSVQCIRF